MGVHQDFIQVTAVPLHHILVCQECTDIEKLIDDSLVLASCFLFRLSIGFRLSLALCRVLVL